MVDHEMSEFSELLSLVVLGWVLILLVMFLAGNFGYLVRSLFRFPRLFRRQRRTWAEDGDG